MSRRESSNGHRGIASRLGQATIELNRLESELVRARVDPYTLADFREAIDHVRLTCWWVQAQRKAHAGNGNRTATPALLRAERFRRAIRLCNDLARDVEDSRLTTDSEGMEQFHDLLQAVERLSVLAQARAEKVDVEGASSTNGSPHSWKEHADKVLILARRLPELTRKLISAK